MKQYEINLYKSTEKDLVWLPVVYPAPIQCYLPISIISNIVTANMNNLNWIMHNFVQLFTYNNEEKIETFPVQQFMYGNQATISCKEITNEVMNIERIDIVEDIIYCIEHNHYVVVYLDESQIPGMRSYQKKSIVHSQFIFGFNRKKNIFKVMNFSNVSNKMEVIDVSFSDIQNNFYSAKLRELYKSEKNIYVRDKGYQIYALLYCDNTGVIDASLNFDVLKEQIRQYLYSIDSSVYTSYFTGSLSGTWGMEVYEKMEDLFLKKIDIRLVSLLCEHKLFMQYRINYFDAALAEEYSTVVDIAYKFKMHCLRCLARQQDKEFTTTTKYLKEMRRIERDILIKLFSA